MWSVGCIFAEFLQKEPLFRGKSEIDQINLIFKVRGQWVWSQPQSACCVFCRNWVRQTSAFGRVTLNSRQ